MKASIYSYRSGISIRMKVEIEQYDGQPLVSLSNTEDADLLNSKWSFSCLHFIFQFEFLSRFSILWDISAMLKFSCKVNNSSDRLRC